MRVVGLVGGTTLHCCDACRLHWRSRLDDSATNVIGLLLDLVMVATWGALIGLTLGISVCILRIGACGCMEQVIHLLSLVCGGGMLAGACTLGTHCMCKYGLG
jgi:hypothetical protein